MGKAILTIEDKENGALSVKCEFFPPVTEESACHAHGVAMAAAGAIKEWCDAVSEDED